MKNKVIIDILEYLMDRFWWIDTDYRIRVRNVIDELKGERDDVWFTLPDCIITDGFVVYTNTGKSEELTENEAIKRDVEEELRV